MLFPRCKCRSEDVNTACAHLPQSLDGGSIPGLYAAGNAAGGIFFFNYAGGAQLGAATVYGRIAGRELANRAKQN